MGSGSLGRRLVRQAAIANGLQIRDMLPPPPGPARTHQVPGRVVCPEQCGPARARPAEISRYHDEGVKFAASAEAIGPVASELAPGARYGTPEVKRTSR